ncbi:MAG: helix-turn-helix transcriptional regulator [Oscillospiraceae bacterium]|nr:helix-turn-helix transcriptional regulator [Oscillospiraceae bacterium]
MFEWLLKKKIDLNQSTGSKIRRIRTRRKMTTDALAKKCNITKSAIRHYEGDFRIPNEEKLQEIAAVLNVDISALYDRKISSIADMMQTLFELENDGYVAPTQIVTDDSTPRIAYGVCSLNEALSEALENWHQMHELLAKEQLTEEEYKDWQDAFPLQYQTEQPDETAIIKEIEQSPQQSNTGSGSRYRRKGLLRIRTHEGHLIAMRNGSEISEEQLNRICEYVNCSVEYLTDDMNLQFTPKTKQSQIVSADREMLDDVLGMMDMNADTEIFRVVQVQLSRIVLYHLAQKGFDRESFRSRDFLQEKMDYLYLGKKPRYNTSCLGFFYTELALIRKTTGLSFQEMFTGIK